MTTPNLYFKKIEKFMRASGQNVRHELTELHDNDDSQIDLYMKLIKEEFNELSSAYNEQNLVEIADGVGDLIWVLVGFSFSLGIPLSRVFSEISRSNLSKIGKDGKVLLREDGKILKPKSYRPPNIKKTLLNVKPEVKV